jgi:hypothetical protein
VVGAIGGRVDAVGKHQPPEFVDLVVIIRIKHSLGVGLASDQPTEEVHRPIAERTGVVH